MCQSNKRCVRFIGIKIINQFFFRCKSTDAFVRFTPVVGETPLEVNAVVMNKDIGYIKEGQQCVIKVDTFDFQKYGTIEGRVEVVNPYSVDNSKDTDKDKNSNTENESGGYPVRVKMQSEILKTKNGDVYKVRPGMSVMAEVNVGKRRVIEFFLFPIIRYLDEGLKVR